MSLSLKRTDSKTVGETVAALIAVLIVLVVLSPFLAAYNAYFTSLVWNIFTPFGYSADFITFAAISFVVNIIIVMPLYDRLRDKNEKKTESKISKITGHIFASLLIGPIVYLVASLFYDVFG